MTAIERARDRLATLRLRRELTRIRAGVDRLMAAGKLEDQAIAAAVDSQMDEYERVNHPDFYHWRRECRKDAGAWRPPKEGFLS